MAGRGPRWARPRVGAAEKPAFARHPGLATFAVTLSDAVHAIEVEFTDQSPLDGTVNVSIDGGTPFLHTLPPELL